MPANMDLPIVLWRQWLERCAGPVPTCTPDDPLPPLMLKEQVYLGLVWWHHRQGHVRKAKFSCTIQLLVFGNDAATGRTIFGTVA
jgi:hypothetical protein